MERIGIADVFVEHGPQKVLRSEYGIDVPDIVRAAKRLMKLLNSPQMISMTEFTREIDGV